MTMAAAGQQEGFNFGFMNSSNDFGVGSGVGGGGIDDDNFAIDADNFAIDADAFFSILDEDHIQSPVGFSTF